MSKLINKVAVIGGGTLGSQIAMLASDAGYQVKIFDSREKAFSESLQRLRSELQDKSITPLIPWERWEACSTAIVEVLVLREAAQDADLVIEAIPENVELKRRIFQELGRNAPDGAILATNSSSIPVSRLEESSGRPEHCLNLHFNSPLQGCHMVDIMGGTMTLPEIMESGAAWVRSIGCIPLVVKKEIMGFCFNRIWRAVKREALYMWANGFVDFRDIDRGWMIWTGMSLGPFGLIDSIGLDVVYDIEMVYYTDSKNPKDYPPPTFKEKIEKGELGVKTGRGFYKYPDPEFLRPDFLNPRG